MSGTRVSAPTGFIDVDGASFAYRRWGNAATGQPPLFVLQHFRGGMDHWDPPMTDGLAAGREVTCVGRAPCRRECVLNRGCNWRRFARLPTN